VQLAAVATGQVSRSFIGAPCLTLGPVMGCLQHGGCGGFVTPGLCRVECLDVNRSVTDEMGFAAVAGGSIWSLHRKVCTGHRPLVPTQAAATGLLEEYCRAKKPWHSVACGVACALGRVAGGVPAYQLTRCATLHARLGLQKAQCQLSMLSEELDDTGLCWVYLLTWSWWRWWWWWWWCVCLCVRAPCSRAVMTGTRWAVCLATQANIRIDSTQGRVPMMCIEACVCCSRQLSTVPGPAWLAAEGRRQAWYWCCYWSNPGWLGDDAS
jgi:hypothetical protein